MNKRQKLQVSLAALIVVYIIVWLFFPGWEASKILGISSGVLTLLAICFSYRAEEKNKTNTDKKNQNLQTNADRKSKDDDNTRIS